MGRLKISAILFILTISIPGIGQHFEKKVDKFTGQETLYTKFETVYRKLGFGEAGEKIDFSIFKIRDSLFLCLSIRLGGSKFIDINQSQLLYLRPEKGESIKLPAVSSESSIRDRSLSASYLTQMYLIPDIELNKLRNSTIEAIRIEHASGNLDFEIKNKFSGLFAKVLNEK